MITEIFSSFYLNTNQLMMKQQQTGNNESQKYVSLPKIHKKDQEDLLNYKPLKAFHKVKWSIAPKCLIQGHDGQQIIYICINPQCSEKTRFVCQQCFFKNHSHHNQQFLAIDEVKKGSIQKLRYWPFQHKFRKIFQFINKHQSYVANMVQDVNATFNGMAIRIINTIDKIRLSLLKKIDTFYVKQTKKQQFSNKVKEDLQQCFQMKQLRQIVRQIFCKEIRHDIFLERMKNLLNDESVYKQRETLLAYFDQSQKGIDMIFDKMYFLKKQNWIIQQIQEQKKTLKETQVVVDELELGMEKIIPQTIAYLDKSADELYPLTFQKKILEDQSQYVGFLSQNSRVLLGMRTYVNGFVYYGEWKLNSKNGWGVYENKTKGYKYAGYWKEDKKNGFGREESLVSIYQGNFSNDKKDGFGVCIQNGIRDEITWKADKRHGQGKRIQKNGVEREIYYLNGIQSTMKSSKTAVSIDLKALSKKYSSTTKIPN